MVATSIDSSRDGQPAGAGELLVVADREQRRAQADADAEHEDGQGDGPPQVGGGHRRDGAEQVADEVGVGAAGELDEQDAAGDAAVEHEREREVAAGPAALAHQLDDDRADDRRDDGARQRRACPAAPGPAQLPTSQPSATPVRATCPMPSPRRAIRRCTRNVPTTGRGRADEDARRCSARCMRGELSSSTTWSHAVTGSPPRTATARCAAAPGRGARACGRATAPACSPRARGGGPSCATRPWRSTTARSISGANGPSSCRITTTVVPASCRRLTVSTNVACVGMSMPEVGSSRTSRSGSRTRARAMSTRCCWPPDSSCTALERPVGQAHVGRARRARGACARAAAAACGRAAARTSTTS